MKARLITRCGCERTIDISAPPPPVLYLPLRPPKFNEGHIRQWMDDAAALKYDPKLYGMERRTFKLSLESLSVYEKHDDAMVWYDEATDYDPPGFNADLRSYKPPAEGE